MTLDEQDAEYLRKLAEKAIREAGGTYPVQQLCESDYDKFNGVNIQGHATVKPEPEEDMLALYIVDADQRLSKRFKVTKAMLLIVERGTSRIIYGTTDPAGKQTKIIIQWEREKRVGSIDRVSR